MLKTFERVGKKDLLSSLLQPPRGKRQMGSTPGAIRSPLLNADGRKQRQNWAPTDSDASRFVSKHSLSADNPEIFRGTTSRVILRDFGVVFDNSRRAKAGFHAEALSPRRVVLQEEATLEDPRDAEEAAADDAYFESRRVDSVDVFVSHVWNANRYLKALAMYFHCNCRVALVASYLTFGVAVVVIGTLDDGLVSYGGNDTIALFLIYLPIAVFFVLFFTAHHIAPLVTRRETTFWFDKLSVHQTRERLKLAGITALPEFVAKSDRMLILWNDSYFERLWCVGEVSTFSSLRGANNIDFQPLWLAPWALTLIVLNVVVMGLAMILDPICQDIAQVVYSTFGESPLSDVLYDLIAVGLCLLLSNSVTVIPTYAAFSHKIKATEMLTSHVTRFKLANAKCTVESDRATVVSDVHELFGTEAAFEEFMKSELLGAIHNRVGSVTRIPYWHTQLAYIPLTFFVAFVFFYCDGYECSIAAEAEGFDSVNSYMLTQVGEVVIQVLVLNPCAIAVMLKGIAWTRSATKPGWGRIIAGCAAVSLTYLCYGMACGMAFGLLEVSMTTTSAVWKVAVAVFTIAFIVLDYHLFFSSSNQAAPGESVSLMTNQPPGESPAAV